MSTTISMHLLESKDSDSQRLPYNYVPSLAAGIIFVTLFGLSTLMHFVQSIRYRMWWLLPTVVLGGIGEIIGWVARTLSSQSPHESVPFTIQITTTIISPTFILASNFIIVGRLIPLLGTQYSRLKPRFYAIVFVTCDVVALLVQALGGAKAASGSNNDDPKAASAGGNIMLAGIIFQLTAIAVYIAVTFEVIARFLLKKPLRPYENNSLNSPVQFDQKLKLMVVELVCCILLLFTRSTYRTIELANGWTGKVISTQWLFLVFDAAMIAAVMISLNVLHPGRLLQPSLDTYDRRDSGEVPLEQFKTDESGDLSRIERHVL